MDEPGGQQESHRPPLKLENTYQMVPDEHFPVGRTQKIIGEVLSSYLTEERYEPELCRQMSKQLSEVIHMQQNNTKRQILDIDLFFVPTNTA